LKFKVPVINMWKYKLDDVIERQRYLLIPYCLMKYRKLLNPGKITDEQRAEFKKEMDGVMEKAHELHKNGKISSTFFPPLMKMIILISNHINEKFINDSEIRKELTQMNSVLNPLGSETIEMYLRQGEERNRRELAIDMLKDGKPLNEIVKYSRFNEEVIIEMAKERGFKSGK